MAVLVRRFQGLEFRSSRSSETESLSFLDLLDVGFGLLGMLGLGWDSWDFDEDRRWNEEGGEVGGTLIHLRNLWLPHFKHGKEKLCRGFDLSAAIATGFQSVWSLCFLRLCVYVECEDLVSVSVE